ncbi:MAG: hypothetical protein IJH65_04420 [Methanobrevibacter sp.]|nr:hypothetical protein [Methanobrevibacter sp.]
MMRKKEPWTVRLSNDGIHAVILIGNTDHHLDFFTLQKLLRSGINVSKDMLENIVDAAEKYAYKSD